MSGEVCLSRRHARKIRQHWQSCDVNNTLGMKKILKIVGCISWQNDFSETTLPQSLWQIWQELSSLSSCSIRLQWVPGHSFLPRNDTADELARRGALLVPCAIPCSLSPLISRIHSCFFSDWRRTVSSKFFDTQVPTISTEELVLRRYACCVLSRLRCNGHSLLFSSYLCRIGRIENPSCSACGHSSHSAPTSHSALSSYGLFTLLTLWRLSVSLQLLVQTLGSCQASGALWSSTMSPSLGRGRVTNNNSKARKASRNEFVEKGGMPDRVESFREINSRKGHSRARHRFVKPIRNGLRKIKYWIESKWPARKPAWRGENGIRLQKEE